MGPSPLLIPVSVGELLDKHAILAIKRDRISDPEKRRHIETEYEALNVVFQTQNLWTPELKTLYTQLKSVNECLWDIENEIRACENHQQFDDRFVKLARAVYMTNDQRGHLKKAINLASGSVLVEEKQYTDYKSQV